MVIIRLRCDVSTAGVASRRPVKSECLTRRRMKWFAWEEFRCRS